MRSGKKQGRGGGSRRGVLIGQAIPQKKNMSGRMNNRTTFFEMPGKDRNWHSAAAANMHAHIRQLEESL
jgi:hypothetical protein